MSDISQLSAEQKTVIHGRLTSVIHTIDQTFNELYDIDLSIRIARKNLNDDGTVETGSALVRLNDIVEDLVHLLDRLMEGNPDGPKQ